MELAISIIIPTYKPQNYIIECFISIESQSFDKKCFEVLVILNGEREPYYAFLEKELIKYNFNIRFFYTDIQGVSNARNIGIDESKGKYIAFIDDDDLVSENYLQGLYDIAKNGIMPLSYILAFKDNISFTENYHITNQYEKMINGNPNILNTRKYFSIPVCKLINREIIGTYRFDTRFKNGEDSLFMFAISKKKQEIQFTDRTAVYYRRIRNNSLTTVKRKINYRIRNCFNLMLAITVIYLKEPKRYSFLFFLSRIFAFIKSKVIRVYLE